MDSTDDAPISYSIDNETTRFNIASAVEEQHRLLAEQLTEAVRHGNEAVLNAEKAVGELGRRTETVVKRIETEVHDVRNVVQKIINDVKHLVSDEGIVGQSINQITTTASTAQDLIVDNLPDMDETQKQQIATWSMIGIATALVAVAVVGIVRCRT